MDHISFAVSKVLFINVKNEMIFIHMLAVCTALLPARHGAG